MVDVSEKNILKEAIFGTNQTSKAFHRSVLLWRARSLSELIVSLGTSILRYIFCVFQGGGCTGVTLTRETRRAHSLTWSNDATWWWRNARRDAHATRPARSPFWSRDDKTHPQTLRSLESIYHTKRTYNNSNNNNVKDRSDNSNHLLQKKILFQNIACVKNNF